MVLFRKKDLIYIVMLIAIFMSAYFFGGVTTSSYYRLTPEKINEFTLKAEQGDIEAFEYLTKHYQFSEQNISRKIDFFRKHQDKGSILKTKLLTYCKFAEYRCRVDSENNTAGFLLDCELIKKQCEEFTQKEF